MLRPPYAPRVKNATVTATRPITWPKTPAVPTVSTEPNIRDRCCSPPATSSAAFSHQTAPRARVAARDVTMICVSQRRSRSCSRETVSEMLEDGAGPVASKFASECGTDPVGYLRQA